MAQIEVAPLMVKGKAEDGTEVEVDVALLLATDETIRTTFAAGLQKMLDTGFQADYSVSVAFIFSDVYEDNASTVVQFPKEHFGTYLKEYIPGFQLED